MSFFNGVTTSNIYENKRNTFKLKLDLKKNLLLMCFQLRKRQNFETGWTAALWS